MFFQQVTRMAARGTQADTLTTMVPDRQALVCSMVSLVSSHIPDVVLRSALRTQVQLYGCRNRSQNYSLSIEPSGESSYCSRYIPTGEDNGLIRIAVRNSIGTVSVVCDIQHSKISLRPTRSSSQDCGYRGQACRKLLHRLGRPDCNQRHRVLY